MGSGPTEPTGSISEPSENGSKAKEFDYKLIETIGEKVTLSKYAFLIITVFNFLRPKLF